MNKILVSACLLGHKVRYDGNHNLQDHARFLQWHKAGRVITVCPEMAGGLPTPRAPAEIQPNKTAEMVLKHLAKIVTIDGDDVSKEYIAGANHALDLVKKHKIKVAILKARSPSCGSEQVYDGNFSGNLIDGSGVVAKLLMQNGVIVFDEYHIDEALDEAESHD